MRIITIRLWNNNNDNKILKVELMAIIITIFWKCELIIIIIIIIIIMIIIRIRIIMIMIIIIIIRFWKLN